jgi:serine/threonine protein kinase
MREVEQLSKVRHPDLVCLFGYCDEEGDQYLVYQYCANGNLAQNLLSKGNIPVQLYLRLSSSIALLNRFILKLIQHNVMFCSVLDWHEEVTLCYHGKQ